jgi:peptidoglycan hydrolase CwlO-like protein
VAAGGLALAGPAGAEPAAITEQRFKIRQLEAVLVEVQSRADRAAADRRAAEARLRELAQGIRRNTTSLVAARVRLRAAQITLGDRLDSLYRRRTPTLLEVVFVSASLSDAIARRDAIDRAARRDAELAGRVGELRDRVAAAGAALRATRAEVRVTARRARAREGELVSLAGQRRVLLGQAQVQLEALIRAERERQIALARARAAAAARARAARAAAAAAAARRSAPSPAPATAAPSAGAAPPPAVPAGAQAPVDAPPTDVPDHLDRIAQCESGGNPRALSPGGTYRGKYQFHPDTWRGLGGRGDPAAAPEAEQDRLAAKLYGQSGGAPWPVCSRR